MTNEQWFRALDEGMTPGSSKHITYRQPDETEQRASICKTCGMDEQHTHCQDCNRAMREKERNTMRQYITDDGYTFYMQPNGSLTDNENPELADLEYRSLEELEEAVGECEEVGKRAALKAAAKSSLESLISQCNREIANLERFEDSRMLVATFDLQMSYERAIAAADALEAYVKDVR